MRELVKRITENMLVEYEENIKKRFNKRVTIENSFRVYENGFMGIHYNVGEIDEEEGFRRAEENLKRQRPYPFELESGVRARDLSAHKFTEEELVETADRCMKYLLDTYPDYTFNAKFSVDTNTATRKCESGMDFSNRDGNISCGISFKHKDSKDVCDGDFTYTERTFNFDKFKKMSDDYLANFTTVVDFPDEIIIDEQYYSVVGSLLDQLIGEKIDRKTSLFSDKVGEKVFSDDLTVMHNVSDKESWCNPFWDGDGCTYENDEVIFIDHGTILNRIADKRDARKYNIPHTGTAYQAYADIPSTGGVNPRLVRSDKTVKELLNGRCAVIPVLAYGGGFNEKGDYTMPVHHSLLFDGEKVLGQLPPFTIVSNIYDMFGKDYIGVGSDQPIYNDKQILYRANRGELK